MDEEMENVKRTLRSLVVSSPAIVDVRSLMRDYRQMVGRPVPCDKFGYRDVLSFLKERCSDCFLFQGMPDNPILTLIVPDSLKHIDKFVQRSKTNPKTKCKGKRRSVPESAVRPPTQNLIVSTFSKKSVNTKTESTHNLQSNRKEYYKAETKPKTGDPPKPTNVNIDKTPSYKSVPNLNKVEEERSEVDSTSCSRSALKNFLRKRIPMYNSQNLDGDFNDKDSSHDSGRHTSDSARCTDSARQTLSSASSRRLAQRDQLLDELMQILKESCQDTSAADLFRLYRARYNRELEFSHLGYTSIVALVAALGERVQLSRDDEGVRVRVAGAPPSAPPAAPRAPPRPAPTRLPRAPARVQDVPVDAEDALPGIAFDPDVFPSDCLHFLESIPAVSIDDVSPGDNLEVNVAEVYSPSHFWMILRGEEYNLALDEVMDNMNEYYNSEAGQRALLPGAALVGHYCAALYLQDWHRALVVGVPGAATLQIRHIDYGTVDTVAAAALRPLRREFSSLPAQAVRGRLAGARPAAGGRHWPRPAAAAFLSAVRDTPLVACVANVCRQESILEVFLIDTSTAVDRDISTELIRADHADPREDSALLTSERYLRPSFAALEAGAAPSYAELQRYLRLGLPLPYVHAYRRHVLDSPEPAPAPGPATSTPVLGDRAGPDYRSSSASPRARPASGSSDSRAPSPSPSPSSSSVELPASPSPSPPPPPPPRPRPPPANAPSVPSLPARAPPTPRMLPPAPRPAPGPTPLSPFAPQFLPFPQPLHAFPFGPYAPPAPQFCPPGFRFVPPQPHFAPQFAPRPDAWCVAPPPGFAPRPPRAGVTLSERDVDTYRRLSEVDARAAHMFMQDAIAHACAAFPAPPPAPPARRLNPLAAEFRAHHATQTDAVAGLAALSQSTADLVRHAEDNLRRHLQSEPSARETPDADAGVRGDGGAGGAGDAGGGAGPHETDLISLADDADAGTYIAAAVSRFMLDDNNESLL